MSDMSQHVRKFIQNIKEFHVTFLFGYFHESTCQKAHIRHEERVRELFSSDSGQGFIIPIFRYPGKVKIHAGNVKS
jgi:hypothetical protein